MLAFLFLIDPGVLLSERQRFDGFTHRRHWGIQRRLSQSTCPPRLNLLRAEPRYLGLLGHPKQSYLRNECLHPFLNPRHRFTPFSFSALLMKGCLLSRASTSSIPSG